MSGDREQVKRDAAAILREEIVALEVTVATAKQELRDKRRALGWLEGTARREKPAATETEARS